MAQNGNNETTLLILRALEFASIAHRNQKRKYNNEPYINHCIDVARILQMAENVDTHMTMAAVLHDTVEDCGVHISEIEKQFGEDVRQLVSDLTDVSKKTDGNREERNRIDREHSAKTSRRAKTIKLADIISNLGNIVSLSPEFASVYIPEKEKLLTVLEDSDEILYKHAIDTLNRAKQDLKQKNHSKNH